MLGMGWVNPCGGRRWQTLADGRIEIEGEGIPLYEPGSAQFAQMKQAWDNWSGYIRSAARRHDVPVSWMIAIMTMETGPWADNPQEQATIVSPAGAVGPMQVMPATGEMLGFRGTQLYEPRYNIQAGAGAMRYWMDRGASSLPEVSSRYNSGRLCGARANCGITNEWRLCAASNYPRKTILWNNAAIEHLGLGFSLTTMLGVGLGVAGVGWAIAIATGARDVPKLPRFG